MSNCSLLSFYLDLIKKAHTTFYQYISHLPEDSLDWRLTKFTPTARWIITHVIKDQLWFAKLICSLGADGYNFTEKYPEFTLDKLLSSYRETVEKIEKMFETQLDASKLESIIDYKGYKMTVEEALFEYLHHLILHEGQIAQIINAWKRKKRSLEGE